MAHEVEQMMYVGQKPWHGLGRAFIMPPTLEEALVAAGLDWEVGTKKLQTVDAQEAVPALATYRKTDGRILGVVGPTYRPLQNVEAFEFFRPFIEANEASIETAGSLRSGQRVFVLAKINRDPMVVKGDDVVDKYVLLSNSHDGTLAVRVGFTSVRVVCQNTLHMAHEDKASKLLRIKHSGNVSLNLNKVQEIMNMANAEFEATAEQYRLLANTQISAKDLEKYVKVIFAQKKTLEEKSLEEINSRVLSDIIPLFEKGRGNDMPEIRGTYWSAYNAVTEYLQYNRGATNESRMDSMWFGSSAQLNKKALDTAVTLIRAA